MIVYQVIKHSVSHNGEMKTRQPRVTEVRLNVLLRTIVRMLENIEIRGALNYGA